MTTIILNHINHIQPDHYILPYPSAFPWSVPFTGLIYRLHFLFESLASWAILVLTAGYDSIFIFFVFLMIGKLREISHSLTHIDAKSDSKVIVKRCVSQYCVLLKCRDNLQKIFGPVILCMMATNAIVLCTQMYQMTQSDAYRNAIYATNWYGDKRFMTAIVIMLQQKPLVLTACNFSIVSIDIFTKILNTTISYYFLLKTLE
ncbi:uncharacterized protein [Chelonus insularis]|uniref:uncharacterized protein n=1 Tax=Chelonus insularis TaxID=460826 RepID=UPI00158ADCDB|nr:uncharacterized protein LOC118064319 [Chelonus insularis]